MKTLTVLLGLTLILMSGVAGAQETFDEITPTAQNPIVDTILDFDNMEIHLTHSQVRSYKIYRDIDGNEVRREHGPNFIYKNADEDDIETPYDDTIMHTIFMQELDLNKAKVKNAVKAMEIFKKQ